MIAAFSIWCNRIAPVFDEAQRIRVVEARSGHIVRETNRTIESRLPAQKALRLSELSAGTLVCGAISRPMLAMLTAQGIRVIPFVSGDLRDVINAWIHDELAGDRYAMPGCRRRRVRACGPASRRPRNAARR